MRRPSSEEAMALKHELSVSMLDHHLNPVINRLIEFSKFTGVSLGPLDPSFDHGKERLDNLSYFALRRPSV